MHLEAIAFPEVRIKGYRLWDAARSRLLVSFTLGAVALFAIACSSGTTEVSDESYRVGASSRLLVDSENGRVEVRSGAGGTIQVQATLRRPDRLDYQVSQEGDIVSVKAKSKDGFRLFDFGQSPGADIVITTPSNTTVDLRTSNGRIVIRGIQASGSLETSNGRVVMEDVDGVFDVSASNGAITVQGAKGTFDLETNNGSIEFSGEIVSGGTNSMRTSNGNITLTLEGEPSLDVDASTSNGTVFSSFPITTTSTGDKNKLAGIIGTGEAKLNIDTSNGSIRIQ